MNAAGAATPLMLRVLLPVVVNLVVVYVLLGCMRLAMLGDGFVAAGLPERGSWVVWSVEGSSEDERLVVAVSSPLLLLLPQGGLLLLLSPLELLISAPFVGVTWLSEGTPLFGWELMTGREGGLAAGEAVEACIWLGRPTGSAEAPKLLLDGFMLVLKPGAPLLLYCLTPELVLLLSPSLTPGARFSGLLCRLGIIFVVVSTTGGVSWMSVSPLLLVLDDGRQHSLVHFAQARPWTHVKEGRAGQGSTPPLDLALMLTWIALVLLHAGDLLWLQSWQRAVVRRGAGC